VNGYINGFSLNGAAYPSWVIRAVVAAVAAATFTVAQTRTTFASAFGDAVVSVHLTQTHTIQARASASASATVDVTPTLKYAGHSNATATAFGAGAVRRDVFGFAGGDATCTGEALTAQAIGEASATSASSVVRSDAHIVFFGRALTPCTATGTAAGKVTRYPTVLAGWGEVLYRRGEASVKRSGHSYYEHDGYVLLATLGSFDYCDSTGAARSFVKFSARALGTGVCTGLQATAIHNHRPRVTVQATASATVVGTRTVLPVATATATATAYALKGQIIHASTGSATAQATVLSASALRTAKGYTEVWAYANVAKPIENGVQYRSTVLVSANGTGTAAAKQRHAGLVNVSAQALSARATATHNQAGHVSDALASATVGRAYGLTNSEVPAPDDRSMSVPAEDRGMTVFAEERTMVVTA